MKKIFFLILSLLMVAFVQTAKADVTVNGLEGEEVFIKALQSNKYVFAAEDGQLATHAKENVLLPADAVFKFERCTDVVASEEESYIGTYKIFSVKQGKYVNVTESKKDIESAAYEADADSATQWHLFAANGVENAVYVTADVDNTQEKWWWWRADHDNIGKATRGIAGQMKIEVAPTDFSSLIDELTAELGDYQAHHTELFYPTQAKCTAMGEALAALQADGTVESYTAGIVPFTFGITDCNLPVAGTVYYVTSMDYYNNMSGARLAAKAGHIIQHYADNNLASRNTWIFENGETAGDYYIKNALTGDYVQAVTRSKQVTLGSTRVLFTIQPAARTVGYCAIKTKVGGDYEYLHLDQYGKIVGWTKLHIASQWALAELTDTEAAEAAEHALTTAEIGEYRGPIADQLGVEPQQGVTSLRDYVDGIVNCEDLYELANNNVYRIKMGAGSTLEGYVLGLYTITADDKASLAGTTIPRAVVNPDEGLPEGVSRNMDVLWQLKKVEGEAAVKLVHYNMNATGSDAVATIGTVIQNSPSWDHAATFTTEAGGCAYKLAVKDVQTGTLTFLAPTRAINFESAAGLEGILNRWDGGNAAVVLEKIDKVEIPLTHIPASNGSYATVCVPFDIESVDGATALYLTTINDAQTSAVTEEFPSGIPAKQGAILVGADEASQVATLNIGQATPLAGDTQNILDGTTVTMPTLDDGFVYLTLARNAAGVVGMRRFTNNNGTGSGIAANKGFIKLTESAASSISFVSFLINDDLTAVDGVETTAAKTTGVIYDLQGRKVSNPTRGGIYIQNGQKVVF